MTRVTWVHQGPQLMSTEVELLLKALLGIQVFQDLEVLQEPEVLKVHQDYRDIQALQHKLKVPRVCQDFQVLGDLKVKRVPQEG